MPLTPRRMTRQAPAPQTSLTDGPGPLRPTRAVGQRAALHKEPAAVAEVPATTGGPRPRPLLPRPPPPPPPPPTCVGGMGKEIMLKRNSSWGCRNIYTGPAIWPIIAVLTDLGPVRQEALHSGAD